MTKVAFLGLGAMGAPMARRVLSAGLPLTVWNRTPERARPLAEAGARVAATPREAAAGADVVATMLADPAAVEAAALGPDGLLAGAPRGAVWLDFSTVAPADSLRFAARAAEAGVSFCDVPVAGSVAPATDGTLIVLAGGEPADLERAAPVLEAVARHVERFGPAGAGAAVKVALNLLLGASLAGFAEALALADRHGVPAERAAAFLLGTPLAAPYLRTKYDFLLAGGEPPQFALGLAAKDMRLAAESSDGGAPVASGAYEAFRQAAASGLAGADFSHVVRFRLGRLPGRG